MSKGRGKKRAHTGSVRGETPPGGDEAASAPPHADPEQVITAFVDRHFSEHFASEKSPSDQDLILSRLLSQRLAPVHPNECHLAGALSCLREYLESDTPLFPAAAPATPTTPPSTSRALLPTLADSPRTKQAKDSVNKLKQLATWGFLHIVPPRALQPGPSWLRSTELKGIIPEFERMKDKSRDDKSGVDKSRVEMEVSNVYSNLAAKLASYSDVDEALSLVLVHLARSLPAPKLGMEGVDANIRFPEEFGRDYYGDAPGPLPASSGTGKSRLVYECRHRTPLLYVCVRKRTSDGLSMKGYPFPDRGVRAFFDEAQKTHKDKCNLQIACFLGAWFSELAQRLAERPTQQQKHDYLMQLNHLHLKDGINAERTDFFQTVSERASDTLKRADSSFDETSKHDELFTTHLKSPLAALEREMKYIIAHMYPAQTPTADHHPGLLSLWPSTNPDINQLNSLRRAWNWINTQQASAKTTTFWLVLISTSSSAADFVKHAHRNVLSLAVPIFIGVSFDVLLSQQPSLSCASQASADSHIIYYGRPLWKTFNSGSLWVMANHKLMGGEDFAIRKTAHCFSILASRLALSLSPTESPNSELFARQKQFVDSTVDRHMRIVTHVTSEGVMHVESPSEPVLAIAASNIMLAPYLQSAEKARGYTYADILKKFQQECLLNPDVALLKGSFGELASRIILMVACDAVKRKKIEQTEPKESSDTQHVGASIYAKPVRLESVLRNLADLDEANLAALRQRLEDVYDAGSRTERHAIPIRDQLQSASATLPMWINFTHFDLLSRSDQQDNTRISMALLEAWSSRANGAHTAWHRWHHPGLQGERHAARYMTYIAWEAKNRRDPQSTTVPASSAPVVAGPVIKSASMAPPNEKPLTEQALLIVLFDLGTSTGFKKAQDGSRPQVTPITGQQCPRLCIRGLLGPHAYPCLDLFEARSTLVDILSSSSDPAPNPLNIIEKPMWNERIQPESDSI
ncbi:uncharacterized protein UMAG_04887 [Mycosarcoma maydis]|uniref:Uncharacterized protein n=1 Tax=Mycosarcoma maydis TaxID=5270 RepID=A0A0D1BY73_MYCMD|nr:uncharacterized protein UMAG_04887 [Ustilago maydis 521]KIS66827.1 hypothetical protein UMAG_04887 [Ustilago maydis 521]|eukprot:XP_011391721.1 hypothetical protein UMAG_04887 [Ustilago maydis 521]